MSKARNSSGMTGNQVRNWLGLYVLVLTAVAGAYFFVAPAVFVPLETADRIAAAEIMTPFLFGQVAAVFRFYSAPQALERRVVRIPRWVVMAPPILVSVLLAFQIGLMATGGFLQRADLIPAPEGFKALLTFCVALLNVSTVFVITRYFETASKPASAESQPCSGLSG